MRFSKTRKFRSKMKSIKKFMKNIKKSRVSLFRKKYRKLSYKRHNKYLKKQYKGGDQVVGQFQLAYNPVGSSTPNSTIATLASLNAQTDANSAGDNKIEI